MSDYPASSDGSQRCLPSGPINDSLPMVIKSAEAIPVFLKPFHGDNYLGNMLSTTQISKVALFVSEYLRLPIISILVKDGVSLDFS
jgi:hypothetical protein